MAKIFVNAGAEVNTCYHVCQGTPLTAAIGSGQPELVRALIDNYRARARAGGQLNFGHDRSYHFDPLRTAIDSSKLAAVKILLKCGLWYRLTRTNALRAAVSAESVPILKILLDDFNSDSSVRMKQWDAAWLKSFA
ncbi:hypothetical protein IWX49DRAFT_587820 [Phyllosticta citricarpa]|uniref:Ankyrin repeat protein n=1 Tax=Phyllosticta citricarpa TaxID=55181 RepID=A0ABR1MK96_9PEZI